MKGTKTTLCLVSVCVFALVIAAGTAKSQTETSKSAGKTVSLTGCLQSGTDPGTFTLTNVTPSKGTAKGSETYQLTAASGVDLKEHVGHKVQISGMLEPSKSGTELARTEPGAASMGTHRVEVKSVKEVSSSCP
jgi:hypothetical protein